MYFEQFYVCCRLHVSYMDRFRGCGPDISLPGMSARISTVRSRPAR